jgi:hypothetical protein
VRAQLDVRAQLLTDDGASLFVQYNGLLEMNQKVTDALAKGASTDYGDQYFRTTPRFETGDPRYAWLNQSVFVAEGRLGPGQRLGAASNRRAGFSEHLRPRSCVTRILHLN